MLKFVRTSDWFYPQYPKGRLRTEGLAWLDKDIVQHINMFIFILAFPLCIINGSRVCSICWMILLNTKNDRFRL
jgi:hypothetical protein